MAYKSKRSGLKRFKEAYKSGVRDLLYKEYKKYQYQTPLTYKADIKGVKVRQFEHRDDAIAFEHDIQKKYPYTEQKLDATYFVGVPCDNPEVLHTVYYSEKPFKLTAQKDKRLVVKSSTYQPKRVECMNLSEVLYRGGLLTKSNQKDYVKNPFLKHKEKKTATPMTA